MTGTAAWIVCPALAYLAGSVPFGLLVGRAAGGIDIRRAGSGNIGATNVARLLGWKWGAVVLLLDGLKGLLPVLLLPTWCGPPDAAEVDLVPLRTAVGVATILGHMFPCWLGFRGGKGVATALGVVAVLGPWATLAAAGTFALVVAVTRYVSLASIAAAACFAVVQLVLLGGTAWTTHLGLGAFSVLVPVLIVVRHRANIGRLLRGTESKWGTRSALTTASGPTIPSGDANGNDGSHPNRGA